MGCLGARIRRLVSATLVSNALSYGLLIADTGCSF